MLELKFSSYKPLMNRGNRGEIFGNIRCTDIEVEICLRYAYCAAQAVRFCSHTQRGLKLRTALSEFSRVHIFLFAAAPSATLWTAPTPCRVRHSPGDVPSQ